ELKKAYELHLDACKKNFNIGDLLMGGYPFDGFYPAEDEIGSEEDEIVWVGNISEKHSGLGVVSPVRMWKNSKDYYYAYPFPKDEVLKVYKDRLKNYKLPRYTVSKEELLRVLNDSNWSDLKVLENDEEVVKVVKSVCADLGIEYNDKSKSVISFEAINTKIKLEYVLNDIENGAFFYFVPDFGNKDDAIWYYPYFRVFRNKRQIDTVLRNSGFKNVKHIILTSHLRAVLFEK
ncbi:MAG TPA: glycosyltransferase family 2 protein, partial [Fervidobacterium nodosum]|nr:glycosyltransferase family 2 protein [Fervidobacterium nodosum]